MWRHVWTHMTSYSRIYDVSKKPVKRVLLPLLFLSRKIKVLSYNPPPSTFLLGRLLLGWVTMTLLGFTFIEWETSLILLRKNSWSLNQQHLLEMMSSTTVEEKVVVIWEEACFLPARNFLLLSDQVPGEEVYEEPNLDTKYYQRQHRIKWYRTSFNFM